ncbi:MAG: hypothetical protein RRZ84_04125 [Romboutsia sp.]
MMMSIPIRKIQDITIANLKNGEVTLVELDEIYRKMGFVFEVSEGKFTRIKKEVKH